MQGCTHPTEDGQRYKVAIVTNGNVFSNIALSKLFATTLFSVDYLVIVTTGLRSTKGNRLREAFRLAGQWGWRYSTYKAATYILPAIRQLLTRRPMFVASTCKTLGIPYYVVRNVNTPKSRRLIDAFCPDLLLSHSCPYKLYPKVLTIPTIGSLNVHSSLLPAYAGVCTYVHVLAEGQSVTGVTIHEMIDDIDAGVIIAQDQYEIPSGISVCRLFEDLSRMAGSMLSSIIPKILADGMITGTPQDMSLRSYRGEPTQHVIQQLRSRGHTLAKFSEIWALNTHHKEN